jgi:hypothetical protein
MLQRDCSQSFRKVVISPFPALHQKLEMENGLRVAVY